MSDSNGAVDFIREFFGELYVLALGLGGIGLFFVALADSSFLSIPEGNDFLIIILSTGQSWERMGYYVMMTVLGSISGCSLLYWVGRKGGNSIEKRLKPSKVEQFRELYQKWGIWTVAVPSVLPPPTPFKIFVLSAGIFRIPYPKFLMAVAIGRTFRYLMWGVLAVLYGEAARDFLSEHIHKVGIVLFVLIVGAVVSYLLIVLRARRTRPQQETT